MEWKTQGSRPRLITQNNPRPRTDPLEAKDCNARGQDQGHNAEVFSKKKKVFINLLRSLWRVLLDEEKKTDHNLGPFFTNQKIVLSLTANRAFSRTCKLGRQSQGLQNMFWGRRRGLHL